MTAPYRVLVTGSRDWTNRDIVHAALAWAVYQRVPAVIVHGACRTGTDAIASQWVREHRVIGLTEEMHPARWHVQGRRDLAAGPRRNAAMVRLGADICVAFIGPCTSPRCRRPKPHGSHGATGCADMAGAAGIPVRRWTARETTAP
jgi:hypothetical protein